MGIEPVSGCLFCASTLFGIDMPVSPGLGGEIGFSYATLARK